MGDKRRIFADGLLRDKVALITGGGTGIGRGIALAMSACGARVVLASRNRPHLDEAAADISARGGRALGVATDVREPRQVDAMLAAAVEAFGRVDILVNNAAGNFLASARRITPGGWRALVDTTLNGTFYCSRAVGEHMIERRGGRIVNITATLHFKGSPGLMAATAAKAGVEAMTKTLALEWARYGILVNAIAPGPIYTPGANQHLWSNRAFHDKVRSGVPLGRFGAVEDVANLAVYLASPAGDYITGATLVVDGGEWLKKGQE